MTIKTIWRDIEITSKIDITSKFVLKMCGIICLCNRAHSSELSLLDIYETCKENIKRRGPDALQKEIIQQSDYNLLFGASILWLQGKSIAHQPLVTDQSVLVYNGDIFASSLISECDRITQGDTKLLLENLEGDEHIMNVLSCVQGPYTFVYLNKRNSKLYFGRDIFGRRSLLIGKKDDTLILTSVASKELCFKCMELPAIGAFNLDLKSHKISLSCWQYQNKNFSVKLNELSAFLHEKIHVIQELPLLQNKLFVAPDTRALLVFEQAKQLSADVILKTLLDGTAFSANVVKLSNLLENAVQTRISTQPKFCQACISQRTGCNHALVGVLFSGGLDCTILALLAEKFCDADHPIDLINVAFENQGGFKTPDRLTGASSFEELKSLRPDRKWNFVEVDVTEAELNQERSEHIRYLIFPLNTILDDSLGCALWFASRGVSASYESPCRVLLVGMGADELFGGYTRHRAALKKHGWQGLHDALDEDWQNISDRNLGRDDRVAADHGRQLRTPYLDEEVVQFARNLNSWEKTYPSGDLPQGLGEKILLRCLAYKLGLKKAAVFKKRALQFGSRIANNKEKAHEISPRL